MKKNRYQIKYISAVKGYMCLRDDSGRDSFPGSNDVHPMFNGKVYKTRKGAQKRLNSYLKGGY